jgi:hypothetical protein
MQFENKDQPESAPQNSSNPFAPPTSSDFLERQPASATESPRRHRSLLHCLMVWALVCTVSAAPSFVWGLNTVAASQAIAMLTGVAIFIAGYTLADFLTQHLGWRQSPTTRLTLKIGYATRIVISILFPVGGTLDLICGSISIGISQHVLAPTTLGELEGGGDSVSFLGALTITVIQGCVLNFVLAAYMLLVFTIIFGTRRLRAS